MGLLENILNQVAPGGQLAPPVKQALNELLAGATNGSAGQGGASPQPASPQPSGASSPQPGSTTPAASGTPGSLSGLLQQLESAGHGEAVQSWVGQGQNASISPDHLGKALGPQTVSNLAQKTGTNEQELLTQLAKALPVLIDRLTPEGRLPNQQQVAAFMRR